MSSAYVSKNEFDPALLKQAAIFYNIAIEETDATVISKPFSKILESSPSIWLAVSYLLKGAGVSWMPRKSFTNLLKGTPANLDQALLACIALRNVQNRVRDLLDDDGFRTSLDRLIDGSLQAWQDGAGPLKAPFVIRMNQ